MLRIGAQAQNVDARAGKKCESTGGGARTLMTARKAAKKTFDGLVYRTCGKALDAGC